MMSKSAFGNIFKAISMLLVLMVMLSAVACTGTRQTSDEGTTAKEQTGQEEQPGIVEGASIKLLFGDMGRTKFTTETYLIKEFARQMENAKLELQLIPRADMRSKVSTLIVAGELPDIMMIENGLDLALQYGPKGLFYPVDTKFGQMPTVSKLIQEYPDFMRMTKAEDRHVYCFPWVAPYHFFTEGLIISPRAKEVGYDPRNDIKTIDDLYDVLAKLKEKYPESSPFVTRVGNELGRIYNAFGTGLGFYYNEETGKYAFGPFDENYKLMIEFLNKAYKAEIMHNDFFTMTEEMWREMFGAEKAFFTSDGFGSASALAADPSNPDTWLISILAPEVNGKRYYASYNRGNISPDEGTWFINAKTKYVDNLIKFVDWGYSDEGIAFMLYGKEGETCEKTPDGFYKYRIPEGKEYPYIWKEKPDETIETLGLRQWTYVFRGMFEDQINPYLIADELGKATVKYYKDNHDYYVNNNAIAATQPRLPFTSDEVEQIKQLVTPIDTYTMENAMKFIKGDRPLSEFPNFIEELKNMGVENALKIYQGAYERYVK